MFEILSTVYPDVYNNVYNGQGVINVSANTVPPTSILYIAVLDSFTKKLVMFKVLPAGVTTCQFTGLNTSLRFDIVIFDRTFQKEFKGQSYVPPVIP